MSEIMPKDEPSIEAMNVLIGRRITIVTFVLDYLQIDFDDALLTVLVWPKILEGSYLLFRSDLGYCDKLCNCIGASVVRIDVNIGLSIEFALTNNMVLSVSMLDEDQVGPEVLLLKFDGSLNVW